MEVSVRQEINQIRMERPHVVILGAGASYAAFPNGDKYGNKLPLMNNLVDILNLEDIIRETDLNFKTNNFEDIYDQIHKHNDLKEVRKKIEKRVYEYFANLEIPDFPTLYDHLVLSLREKDVIATFNWDPFLIQAYRRNVDKFKLPRILFLHGNVAAGYCEKDKTAGVVGHKCPECNQPYPPSKLLYPILEKKYHLDGFISVQWEELKEHLEATFMITIFGYGAPKSDVSAIDLMKSAWGDVNQRNMEQTEIIDIKDENVLHDTWEPFIHSHHYDTHKSFYDSWIANHPRRTGEAYLNQFIDAKFINNNPVPVDDNFTELWSWFEQLKNVEDQNNST